MFNKGTTGLMLLFVYHTAQAQELNIGLHMNPTLTAPIITAISNYDKAIEVGRARLNFNGGINIVTRRGKMYAESGFNIVTKSINFSYSTEGYNPGKTKQNVSRGVAYSLTGTSLSYELPLQFGYLLYHKKKGAMLDLYSIVGASLEMNTTEGFKSKGWSYNAGPGVTNVEILDAGPVYGKNSEYVNLILGFKVNTVIRKLGLIDYGFVYHMPLSNAGQYYIKTAVNNTIYSGDYYPFLSYIDFKLSYYFLNFENSLSNRKKYRKLYSSRS